LKHAFTNFWNIAMQGKSFEQALSASSMIFLNSE